jgi:hypothetical protein
MTSPPPHHDRYKLWLLIKQYVEENGPVAVIVNIKF